VPCHQISMLAKIERKGFLHVVPDEDDARVRRLVVTEKSREYRRGRSGERSSLSCRVSLRGNLPTGPSPTHSTSGPKGFASPTWMASQWRWCSSRAKVLRCWRRTVPFRR
jgi:hypothetical protein